MATFLVQLLRSGPEYELTKPLEEQSGWVEHAAFMDGLVDDGVIVLGGPLSDEYRVVHVFEAESEDVVRATLARDPWSQTHLRDRLDRAVDDPPRRTFEAPLERVSHPPIGGWYLVRGIASPERVTIPVSGERGRDKPRAPLRMGARLLTLSLLGTASAASQPGARDTDGTRATYEPEAGLAGREASRR